MINYTLLALSLATERGIWKRKGYSTPFEALFFSFHGCVTFKTLSSGRAKKERESNKGREKEEKKKRKYSVVDRTNETD